MKSPSVQKPAPATAWRELVRHPDIDAQMIRAATTAEAFTIPEFARWLNHHEFPYILPEFTVAYLETVRPLLEELLPLDADNLELLMNPRQFLDVEEDQLMRNILVERFKGWVDENSPKHVKLALSAYIELGLERYKDSLVYAGFAHNEKAVPGFEARLNASNPEAMAAILVVEGRMAETLLQLIKRRRSSIAN